MVVTVAVAAELDAGAGRFAGAVSTADMHHAARRSQLAVTTLRVAAGAGAATLVDVGAVDTRRVGRLVAVVAAAIDTSFKHALWESVTFITQVDDGMQ